MVLALLGRFARAAAKQGLGDISAACIDPTGISAVNYLGKVAAEVWKDYRQDKKQDKLQADILEAAKLTFEEAKQAGLAAAQQATTDPELQGHIERLVTLIPASIRASLRRPEDPTGTTLPKGFEVHDEQDIVKLLPVRLPRFKAGDAPLWLRGWRLVEQIGAGGFGEVWKVQNTRASNLLGAVKFSHGMSETEFSLLNEGDVLNRLLAEGEHEGIVPLQDMWADGDPVPWIRFKYIDGGDLTTQIHRWQTLSVNERLDKVIAAVSRLAKTVGYFHRLEPKLVHRDLKPSNILVEAKSGNLLIADFGIGAVSAARAIKNERSLSQSQGAVIATYLRGSHTPLYASKQQREGSRLIDPRDDVHALGVIAYQMLTGHLDAAPGAELEDELKELGSPNGLIAIIKRCVARDPNRRPSHASELADWLKAIGTSATPSGATALTPISRVPDIQAGEEPMVAKIPVNSIPSLAWTGPRGFWYSRPEWEPKVDWRVENPPIGEGNFGTGREFHFAAHPDTGDDDLALLVTRPSSSRLAAVTLTWSDRISAYGLAHLANLPMLRTLEVNLCGRLADDAVAAISPLIGLRDLVLHRCGGLSDIGMSRLEASAGLRTLTMWGIAAVSDHGLGKLRNLTSLESLGLAGGKLLTDAAFEPLSDLLSLRSLAIRSCPAITPRGLKNLKTLTALVVYRCARFDERRAVEFRKASPHIRFEHVSDGRFDTRSASLGDRVAEARVRVARAKAQMPTMANALS